MTRKRSLVWLCAMTFAVVCVAAEASNEEKPKAGACFAPGYDLSKSSEYHPRTFEEFVIDGREWPEVAGRFPITYSYSNLLDGGMGGGLSPATLRAVVEEALAVWAAKAPLDFTEVLPDVGPPPGDTFYPAAGTPNLRFGHHTFDGPFGILAHAFFPPPNGGGLAGDVHFDSAENWTTNPASGIDLLEVCVHELGHSLGLLHEPAPPVGNPAIMNPFYGRRYSGLGTAFLLADDCNGIVFVYGSIDGVITYRAVVFTETGGFFIDCFHFSDGNPGPFEVDTVGTGLWFALPPSSWYAIAGNAALFVQYFGQFAGPNQDFIIALGVSNLPNTVFVIGAKDPNCQSP